jgi:hypothetical protein
VIREIVGPQTQADREEFIALAKYIIGMLEDEVGKRDWAEQAEVQTSRLENLRQRLVEESPSPGCLFKRLRGGPECKTDTERFIFQNYGQMFGFDELCVLMTSDPLEEKHGASVVWRHSKDKGRKEASDRDYICFTAIKALQRWIRFIESRMPDIKQIVASSQRVYLYGPHDPPVVDGHEKNVLTDAQYATVRAVLESPGMTKDKLDQKSGRTDARKHLSTLANSDPDWKAVISLPGRAGSGGYRIL